MKTGQPVTSLWERIRRRKVVQWSAAYLAVAWLVLQMVDVVGQNLAWPSEVFRIVLGLLLAGFLVTLVLAWYHGERGAQRVSGIELLMLAGILVIAGAIVALLASDADTDSTVSGTEVRTDGSLPPPAETSAGARSIAVLPLKNLSRDSDDALFAAGIHEEILTQLTKVGDLSVRGRTSVMQYEDSEESLPQISRALRARYLLQGSVQRAGERVQITVQLIDAEQDESVWAESYDQLLTVENLFEIQADLARKISAALHAEITPEEQERLARLPTGNLEAYSLYVTGRHLADRRSTESLNRALDYLNEAIAVDPTYARAYAGVAEVHIALGTWGLLPPGRAFPAAREAAQKALSLDEHLGEAWASLGYIHFWYDRDWQGSERAFRRAIELSPGNSTTHHWYSLLLVALGRFDEAEARIRRAVELDPVSRIIRTIEARLHWIRGDHARAVTAHQRALEIDPGYAVGHMWLAFAYESQGRVDLALDHFQQAAQLDASGPIPLAGLAHGHAIAGRREAALELLGQLDKLGGGQSLVPYWNAVIHTDLGQIDEAFNELERAVRIRDGWIVDLAVTPLFASIRSDPRFASLLERLGLDERQRRITIDEQSPSPMY